LKQTKRQRLILEMIRVKGEVSSKELAKELGVSVMTISRDLNELAKGGEIKLIYGGATYNEDHIFETPMSVKELEYIKEKKAIGKYCKSILSSHSSIFIGPGTTTLAVAREIFGIKKCTFFTNSLLVLNSLSKNDNTTLHAVPGTYRDLSKGFLGTQTNDYIQNFNFDYCVLGTEGICPTFGVTLLDNDDAYTSRAILRQSKCKILVADSSKFGKSFTYKTGDVADFDYIITDENIDQNIFQEISKSATIIAVPVDD